MRSSFQIKLLKHYWMIMLSPSTANEEISSHAVVVCKHICTQPKGQRPEEILNHIFRVCLVVILAANFLYVRKFLLKKVIFKSQKGSETFPRITTKKTLKTYIDNHNSCVACRDNTPFAGGLWRDLSSSHSECSG